LRLLPRVVPLALLQEKVIMRGNGSTGAERDFGMLLATRLSTMFGASAAALAILLGSGPVLALAPQTYRVGIDLGNDASSGCDFGLGSLVPGALPGFELQVTVVVDSDLAPAEVISAQVETCDGAVFGSESMLDGWNVEFDAGQLGADSVVGILPAALLGDAVVVRLAFHALSSGGAEDALFTTDGSADGPPILVSLAAASPVPVASPIALGLAVLLLFAVYVAQSRRGAGRSGAAGAILLLSVGAAIAYAKFGPDVATDAPDDSMPVSGQAEIMGAGAADAFAGLSLRLDIAEIQDGCAVPGTGACRMAAGTGDCDAAAVCLSGEAGCPTDPPCGCVSSASVVSPLYEVVSTDAAIVDFTTGEAVSDSALAENLRTSIALTGGACTLTIPLPFDCVDAEFLFVEPNLCVDAAEPRRFAVSAPALGVSNASVNILAQLGARNTYFPGAYTASGLIQGEALVIDFDPVEGSPIIAGFVLNELFCTPPTPASGTPTWTPTPTGTRTPRVVSIDLGGDDPAPGVDIACGPTKTPTPAATATPAP
jgi:hypothetical protein